MDETTRRRNALIQVLGPALAAKLLAKIDQSGQQTTKAQAGDGMRAVYKVKAPQSLIDDAFDRLRAGIEVARQKQGDAVLVTWLNDAAQQWGAAQTPPLSHRLADNEAAPVVTKAAAPTGDPTGEAPWVAKRPDQKRRNADSFTSWLQGNPPKETDPENFLGLGRIGRLRKKP